MLRAILSIVLIFITITILDGVVHGILLQDTYEDTAHLWRPMEEMKMGLMHVVTLINTILFVSLFAAFCPKPTLSLGLRFGAIIGLMSGISMGIGSYSYMPIPMHLALVWLASTFLQLTFAGAITGFIMTPSQSEDQTT